MKLDKSALLAHIRSLQRELDGLMDMVIALDEIQPEQAVHFQPASSDDWLTVKQVCEQLQISDSTFYEWIKGGLLPPGYCFGSHSKRWKMSEIVAYQKRRRIEEISSTPAKKRGRPSRVMKIGRIINV